MGKIICYTNGQSRGNPGPSAIGIYIASGTNEILKEVQQTIGNASTNFAEYYAVMVGLQTLQTMYGEETRNLDLELRVSSEYVKKHLNNESTISDPGLVPMFIEIHNRRVESFPRLVVTQVTAEENKEAQELVNCVLDGHG